jgi:hypothetical protein
VESLAGQSLHYIPARLGFTENERRRGCISGGGAQDWRHVRISCYYVKEIENHFDLVTATRLA